MKTETCAIPSCTQSTGHPISEEAVGVRICPGCRGSFDDEVRAIILSIDDEEWHNRDEMLRVTGIDSDLFDILVGHLVATKKLEDVANGEYRILGSAVLSDIQPDAEIEGR
jgi:hypothetical protein